MNIQEKLQRVQEQLKAPKSQYNKFGNYYYRNCEDIQEAIKPILKEVKAALVVGDELELIGDRYYIKATATFLDCESQEKITNTAYAREEADKKGMDTAQVTGSTSSYARKYALNGLFCIDDVKDADNQDNGDAGKPEKNKGSQDSKGSGKSGNKELANAPGESGTDKIDKAKINTIKAELKRTGLEEPVVLELFKLRKLEDMTTEQFVKVMKKFNATPTKEE